MLPGVAFEIEGLAHAVLVVAQVDGVEGVVMGGQKLQHRIVKGLAHHQELAPAGGAGGEDGLAVVFPIVIAIRYRDFCLPGQICILLSITSTEPNISVFGIKSRELPRFGDYMAYIFVCILKPNIWINRI